MIKLLDHLYQIKLGYVNAFLIVEESGLTLIDTGLKSGHKGILKGLKAIGFQPTDIKNIIITHSHMDHVGSLNRMKALTNAKIITHPATNEMIKTGDTGLSNGTIKNRIANRLVKFVLIFNKFKIKPVEADKLIYDGDELPIAGGLQVIHAPGHTPGHIVLMMKKDKMLIAADMCRNEKGIADLPLNDDWDLARKTALRVAQKCNFDKACFGHGTPILENAAAIIEKSYE